MNEQVVAAKQVKHERPGGLFSPGFEVFILDVSIVETSVDGKRAVERFTG
jgi:hypothetical protein